MINSTFPGTNQLAGLALFLLSGTMAAGQVVLTPAMPTPPGGNAASPSPPLVSSGPFEIRPSLSYQLTYAEGLQQTPGVASDTTIQTFSPAVQVQLAKRTSVSYTYTRSLYSGDSFRDTEGHNASVSTSRTLGETNLSGSFGYQKSTDVLVETARQTTQESYRTRVGTGRSFGRHTAVSVDLSHADRKAYGVLAPTPELSNPGWVDWSAAVRAIYQFSSQAQAALGATRTISYVNTGPDIVSTRPQIELSWQPTPRINTSLAVGMDYQSYSRGEVKQRSDPTYTLSGGYQLTSKTNLNVSADRATSASHFANQSTLAQTYRVGVSQRLLKRLFFNAGYSYQYSSFRNNFFVGALARKNHVETYTAGISTSFFQRGSLGLSYSESRNNSNFSLYSYATRQMSLNASYQF